MNARKLEKFSVEIEFILLRPGALDHVDPFLGEFITIVMVALRHADTTSRPGRLEAVSEVLARLAIELGYDTGDRPEAASREAVRRARAAGDPGALAAALGARHVALWGPEHSAARLDCAGGDLTRSRSDTSCGPPGF